MSRIEPELCGNLAHFERFGALERKMVSCAEPEKVSFWGSTRSDAGRTSVTLLKKPVSSYS